MDPPPANPPEIVLTTPQTDHSLLLLLLRRSSCCQSCPLGKLCPFGGRPCFLKNFLFVQIIADVPLVPNFLTCPLGLYSPLLCAPNSDDIDNASSNRILWELANELQLVSRLSMLPPTPCPGRIQWCVMGILGQSGKVPTPLLVIVVIVPSKHSSSSPLSRPGLAIGPISSLSHF